MYLVLLESKMTFPCGVVATCSFFFHKMSLHPKTLTDAWLNINAPLHSNTYGVPLARAYWRQIPQPMKKYNIKKDVYDRRRDCNQTTEPPKPLQTTLRLPSAGNGDDMDKNGYLCELTRQLGAFTITLKINYTCIVCNVLLRHLNILLLLQYYYIVTVAVLHSKSPHLTVTTTTTM